MATCATAISLILSVTTRATSSRTTASTSAFTMSVVVTEDRYEHTFDLVVGRNFTLKYHITKVDRLFFDRKSWYLGNTEFHLVGCIIGCFEFHAIGESEFCERFLDEIFEFCERWS